MTHTLQGMINLGYTLGRTTYARGYVSRKTDVKAQHVHTAGGNCKGQLYVDVPCWNSSRYHLRQYLIAPETMLVYCLDDRTEYHYKAKTPREALELHAKQLGATATIEASLSKATLYFTHDGKTYASYNTDED